MQQGRLIVIEGLDGAGKTTVARCLAQRLNAVLMSSSDGALSQVRPVCEALHGPEGLARQLYYAYAVALVSQKIEALLAQGKDVVLDRYWATTLTYALSQDPDAPQLEQVGAALIPATMTCFLEATKAQRSLRLRRRDGQILPQDARSLEQHERLRALYRELLPKLPTTGELVVIDASMSAEVLAMQLHHDLDLLSQHRAR